MLKGMNKEILQSYVAMRRKLDVEVKTIHSITSLLGLYQYCGDDRLSVDPAALGFVHSLLEQRILNIWEVLDDFIYLVEAERILHESNGVAS